MGNWRVTVMMGGGWIGRVEWHRVTNDELGNGG